MDRSRNRWFDEICSPPGAVIYILHTVLCNEARGAYCKQSKYVTHTLVTSVCIALVVQYTSVCCHRLHGVGVARYAVVSLSVTKGNYITPESQSIGFRIGPSPLAHIQTTRPLTISSPWILMWGKWGGGRAAAGLVTSLHEAYTTVVVS